MRTGWGRPAAGGGGGGWPRQRCFPDFKPSLSVEKKIQNFFSSFSSQKQKKRTEPETSRKLRIFNELGKNRFDKFSLQKWLKDGKGWESA